MKLEQQLSSKYIGILAIVRLRFALYRPHAKRPERLPAGRQEVEGLPYLSALNVKYLKY